MIIVQSLDEKEKNVIVTRKSVFYWSTIVDAFNIFNDIQSEFKFRDDQMFKQNYLINQVQMFF